MNLTNSELVYLIAVLKGCAVICKTRFEIAEQVKVETIIRKLERDL